MCQHLFFPLPPLLFCYKTQENISSLAIKVFEILSVSIIILISSFSLFRTQSEQKQTKIPRFLHLRWVFLFWNSLCFSKRRQQREQGKSSNIRSLFSGIRRAENTVFQIDGKVRLDLLRRIRKTPTFRRQAAPSVGTDFSCVWKQRKTCLVFKYWRAVEYVFIYP